MSVIHYIGRIFTPNAIIMDNIQLLTDILAVPTYTHNEERLVSFLEEYLTAKGINYQIDDVGNIMAVKGTAGYYPCVVAHTDTVHRIKGEIEIRTVKRPDTRGTYKDALTGYIPDTDVPTGCGGDDKAGVFICLQLLDRLDDVMAFFPVAEETGCHGSRVAPTEWFDKVGYFIQFDSPLNNTMSKTLLGKPLYDEDGPFWREVKELIQEAGITRHEAHPYTDVKVLGDRFNVECLNVAAGYYQYHRANEYVILDDVVSAVELGERMIKALQCRHYIYTAHNDSEGEFNDLFLKIDRTVNLLE